MKQYRELVRNILDKGEFRDDRTGVGTKALFGPRMEFDLQDGFPLLTTRKMYFKGICDELLWMLSGSTNVDDLPERTKQIWDQDEWKLKDDGLGPSYGEQFRKRKGHFDQVKHVIKNIKENPTSRRHVISLWNQPDMDRLPLACCHGSVIQFYVRQDTYLDCFMHARSQDVAIGMPWNIGFYALLTHMFAHVTNYEPGRYFHSAGDAHIYKNHIDKIQKQIKRPPKELPELSLNKKVEDIDKFEIHDFQLKNYQHHGKVKYPIAV